MPRKNNHTPRYEHSGYFENIEIPNLKKHLADATRVLELFPEVTTLAYSGHSGAILAPILALNLNKTLILVRKESDKGNNSHASTTFEGDKAAKKYIIVDDFISIGATAERIYQQVKIHAPDAELIGVLECDRVSKNWRYKSLDLLNEDNRLDYLRKRVVDSIGSVDWYSGAE